MQTTILKLSSDLYANSAVSFLTRHMHKATTSYQTYLSGRHRLLHIRICMCQNFARMMNTSIINMLVCD